MARLPPDVTILPIALAACAIGVDAVLGKLLSFMVVTLGTFGVLTVAATLAGYQAKGDWLEEQGNLIMVLVLVLIAIGIVVSLNLVRSPSVRARGLLAGALEGCLMAVGTRRRILGVLRPRSDLSRQS